jgi:protein phosphatase
MEIAATTDVGRIRETNEDSIWSFVFAPGAPNPWNLQAILLVADGMGGHQAGEVASGLAADTARRLFTETAAEGETPAGPDFLRRVDVAVREINRTVYAKGTALAGEIVTRPGTTLTIALLRRDEYIVAHIGDSRAYLLRAGTGECEQITDDDSFVAEAVRRGHMSPEQARTSPMRNQITKAVGLQPDVEPSIYHGPWARGDMLLLCSDGLSEYIREDEFAGAIAAAADLEDACHRLTELANGRGGHDNISVLLARNNEASSPEGASSDADTLTDVPLPPAIAETSATEYSSPSDAPQAVQRRAREGARWRASVGVALGAALLVGLGIHFYGGRRPHPPQSYLHVRHLRPHRVLATPVELRVSAEQETPVGPALVVRSQDNAFRARVKPGKNGNPVKNRDADSYIGIQTWKNFNTQITARKAALEIDGAPNDADVAGRIVARLDPTVEYSLLYVVRSTGQKFEMARIRFEPRAARPGAKTAMQPKATREAVERSANR